MLQVSSCVLVSKKARGKEAKNLTHFKSIKTVFWVNHAYALDL
ncbi:unnamed protein product [Arabidopsis thaliana]|uniref:Uncharacterized protein n=3 Tax=Arabidopsis TaxID=3701 RepID=Q9FHH0_ARATH|nr:hypothetical protein ISN45_At05g053650 [Arabidopsis thaliana x Arabidopsis arenosa]KAG7613369.1 hypothetical protein ISN44_As05g052910 [Arabidopsis suecica]BAB09591.1 unnamed protein product [Arabidopsis thaliana]